MVRGALARPELRRYLAGQAVSTFGSSALFIALAIWAKTLTGSDTAAGLVFFVLLVPLAFAPLAGLVVDRFRRKPLLLAVNVATGLLVLLLLLIRGPEQIWLLYLVTFGYGCSTALISSAQSALIRSLVAERDQLIEVNGLLQIIRKNMELFGPLAGGALFAWLGGPAVAVVDAATFLVAAVVLTAIRVDEPVPGKHTRRWVTELAAGIVHIRRTPVLRQILLAVAAGFLVVGYVNPALFAAVEQLGQQPAFVGVLDAVMALGAIVGGFVAIRVLRVLGAPRCVSAALSVLAIGMGLLAVPTLPMAFVAMFLVGVGIPPIVMALATTAQTTASHETLGRVTSAIQAATSGPQVLSAAIGASLVAVVSYQALVVIAGSVLLAAAIWLGTRRQASVTSVRHRHENTARAGE